jgi:hypothetical protein
MTLRSSTGPSTPHASRPRVPFAWLGPVTLVATGFLATATGCGSATMASPVAPSHQASGLSASAIELPPSEGRDGGVTVPAERRIVRNGHLRLEVKNERAMAAALPRLRALAKPAGGFVADEDHDSITLRIPTERLEAVMAQAAATGTVTEREVTARDVTAEYVDLQTRVENLKTTEKRLRELLATTSSVTEILAVEKELTRVTQELETFEARRKLLQSQAELATLRVQLSTAVRPGPVGWVFYGAYTGVKWLFVWD